MAQEGGHWIIGLFVPICAVHSCRTRSASSARKCTGLISRRRRHAWHDRLRESQGFRMKRISWGVGIQVTFRHARQPRERRPQVPLFFGLEPYFAVRLANNAHWEHGLEAHEPHIQVLLEHGTGHLQLCESRICNLDIAPRSGGCRRRCSPEARLDIAGGRRASRPPLRCPRIRQLEVRVRDRH